MDELLESDDETLFWEQDARTQPWGIDTIAPLLLTKENYDGIARDYAWYGKLYLETDGHGGKVEIFVDHSNQEGFDRLCSSLKAYALDSDAFWVQSYDVSYEIWPEPSIKKGVGKSGYCTINHADKHIHFITNPQPVVMQSVLLKLGMDNDLMEALTDELI